MDWLRFAGFERPRMEITTLHIFFLSFPTLALPTTTPVIILLNLEARRRRRANSPIVPDWDLAYVWGHDDRCAIVYLGRESRMRRYESRCRWEVDVG